MRDNIKKLVSNVLRDADALLVTSPVNRRYVTDFKSSDGYVVIAGGKIYCFLDFRYYESARIKQQKGEIDKDIDICLLTNSKEQLKDALSKCKRIMVEDKYLSFERYCYYKELFDFATLVSGGSDILMNCRSVKTEDEIQRIVRAQNITDKTYEYILDIISDNAGKPNFTEKDLQLEIDYHMQKLGADGTAFGTIAVSGTKSSLPHGEPENIPLSKGFLTMDFGAKFDGYCSDMTRTVCIGKPTEEMIKVYNTVIEAQNSAFSVICANIQGDVADKTARDVINNAGFVGAFGHSLGHSLGLEIHEEPNFSPRFCDKVPENAVISVEPGIYLEGKFGVRIEDIVCLKKDGFVNLTKSKKQLVII